MQNLWRIICQRQNVFNQIDYYLLIGMTFQPGHKLSTLAKNWLDAQYAKEELCIKQINAGTTDHEQIIKIEGGLPALPGSNITMPVINGHAVQDNLIAPPEPVVPQEQIPSSNDSIPLPNDSVPSNNSTNGHGSESQGP